jgi:mono/diheme cytochrome c family protein
MIDEPHNVKLNEQPEPSAGNAQVSLGVTVVLILLSYVGCYKADKLNANFTAYVHAPFGSKSEVDSLVPTPEKIMFSRGEKDFKSVCAACHGPTGTGGAQGPALAESEWVNGDPRRTAAIILRGISGPITVNGKEFVGGAMPAVGAAYDDERLAAVVAYIRGSFGNEPNKPYTREQLLQAVGEARATAQKHEGSWTVPTLEAAYPGTE